MSAFSEVLNQIPEEDRALARLAANRYFNSISGQRPSDAARSIVHDYQANPGEFVKRETELRRNERAGR